MRKLLYGAIAIVSAILVASASVFAASPAPPAWIFSAGTIHYNTYHAPFPLSSSYTEYMDGRIAADGACEYSAPVNVALGQGAVGGYVVAVDPGTCQYELAIGHVQISALLGKPTAPAAQGSRDPQQNGYVVSGWYTDTLGLVVNQVTDNLSYAYNAGGDILSVSGSYSFNEGNFVVDGSVGYGPAGVGGTTAEYFTDVIFENASEPGCYIYYRDAAALGSNEGVVSSGTDSYSTGCGANEAWYFQANAYQ